MKVYVDCERIGVAPDCYCVSFYLSLEFSSF